ncbi:hypothetical protein Vadar_033417 [Vaccinium darrowii]|uniref:Uncharacterized protein n=1 Tax=Vaccinium darrowii TaxID=229202 RepID=A0ACB7ZH13_9ERIC|nr:hypothetical protein Vadar_033417 [Vaccinium darrowii]
MDPSTQYQYQQPHDQSQAQPYNTDQSQSAQAYYEYHQYNQYLQQQQYPYYTSAHQQSYQEPTSVHPPGVPITAESQTHVYNQHNPYYPHGIMDQQQAQQQQQWQGNSGGFGPPIGQTAHPGGGRTGGRPYRGRGTTFRGRGRGRGRGGPFPAPAGKPAAFVPGESSQTPVWPPPRMAWCELCRVDCNTAEILEQHKNGKKHKKNLLVYEELQKRNAVLVGAQNEQVPVSEVNQGVSEKNEVLADKVESEQQKVPGEDRFEGGARGLKRKMRGGRDGKWIRTHDGSKRWIRIHDGSKRPMEPPKPKPVVVPLVCELCNVKCDSQVVFQTHLAGKKHLSNVNRFQGEQAMLEQAALQALYPALQAILEQAAIQALRTPNPNASTSFGIQFHGEGGSVHGSQGVFPQVGTLMFPPPGQASTPGPGTTSGLAQNQPSGADKTESEIGTSEVEQKDVNHQADNPVVGPADDTEVEQKDVNHQADNPVVGPADDTHQADNPVVGPADDTEVEQKDVNHQADNPVVGPADDTVSGAEKRCDNALSDHVVAESDNNVEELGSSSKE